MYGLGEMKLQYPGSPLQPQLPAPVAKVGNPEQLLALNQSYIAQVFGQATGAAAAPRVGPVDKECLCLVNSVVTHMRSQGVTLGAPEITELQVQCASDKDSFKVGMRAAGVNFESCKPWYLRRMTLLIGGGVAAALVLRAVLR